METQSQDDHTVQHKDLSALSSRHRPKLLLDAISTCQFSIVVPARNVRETLFSMSDVELVNMLFFVIMHRQFFKYFKLLLDTA